MKLRNLISAALLVGVGSTALPAAAASFHTVYPTNLPANCAVTLKTSLPLLDIRGNEPSLISPGFFVVTCTAPARPWWMTW